MLHGRCFAINFAKYFRTFQHFAVPLRISERLRLNCRQAGYLKFIHWPVSLIKPFQANVTFLFILKTSKSFLKRKHGPELGEKL